MAGSYGSSIFDFLSNLYSVWHSGYTDLHSHQQCTRVAFSIHLHIPFLHIFANTLFLVFLLIAILTGMRYVGFVVVTLKKYKETGAINLNNMLYLTQYCYFSM